MLCDGVYTLTYRAHQGPAAAGDTAIVMIRDGWLLGSDSAGGVFEGSLGKARSAAGEHAEIRLAMPPGGELVTGLKAGGEGRIVVVAVTLSEGRTAVADVAGERLDIAFDYLGPLPPR